MKLVSVFLFVIIIMSSCSGDIDEPKNDHNDSSPAISPDGARLVFMSERIGNNSHILEYCFYTYMFGQLAGYGLRRYDPHRGSNFQWLDNNHIIYTNANGQLIKMNVG